MKTTLSVWTAYYVELSPEDAVRELKKHGILSAELSDEHGKMLLDRGDPVETGRQFRAFLAQEGFTMTQGHLWLKVRLCEENAIPVLAQWLRLYEAIGIENGVLHCDDLHENTELTLAERYDRNYEALMRLCNETPDLKIRVCLENLTRICQNADEICALVDRLPEGRFGICLDTGHLNLNENRDQAAFIRTAGKRLHALHIADNEGQRDQHLMPFGRGNVDFAAVVQALREVGYEGLFNLEIPGERLAPMEILGYKLEYIRRCYDWMMAQ